MNTDDYGKLTYIILNQKDITPQSRLELIYKASVLITDKTWYMANDPKVVLSQEVTTVQTQSDDFMDRLNQQNPFGHK